MSTGADTRQYSLPTVITVIICTIPHFTNIALPTIFICLGLWTYVICSRRYQWPLPGKLLRMGLGTVFFIAAVMFNEGLTIEAFVALLTMMISLKMFELYRLRDQVMCIILCYFLIASCMFFDDSILTFVYILFAILVTTTNLVNVNFPATRPNRSVRIAGSLMFQSIPFMILLFLFFPRIQGGFWGRPPLLTTKSGFADEVTFGSISKLVQSREPAFRVTFSENEPPREQLYWRGIVLTHFDGQTWKRVKGRPSFPAAAHSTATAERSTYLLTLEPHNQHYLFTLDLPSRVYAPRAWGRNDHTWYRWRPVTSRIQYKGISNTGARPTAIENSISLNLQLPQDGNVQSRELVSKLLADSESTTEYLEKTLSWFRNGNFIYTLSPKSPPSTEGYKKAIIDHFLFSSREGFCEHYASALAYLMRAGGVPARLVGGYFGGSRNPYGEHLLIRQSDAHVWCEVLLEDNTWHRVDPTTTVAPNRSESSIAELFASTDLGTGLSLYNRLTTQSWFKALDNYKELINNRWNLWVMGYSRPSQLRFFSRMGINLNFREGRAIAGVVALLLLTSLIAILTALGKRKVVHQDKTARCWLKFCAKLDQIGISRPSHQGPLDYVQTIRDKRPDLVEQASRITGLYIELRFAKEHNAACLDDFIKAVRAFSPTKMRNNE